MISFNAIGNLGRHGNQMFQYAAVLGIARKIGTIPCCSLSNSFCTLPACFELGSVVDSQILYTDLKTYSEPKFGFNEEVFSFDPNQTTNLSGYFQSEKYFKHIEDEVRKNFTFKEDVVEHSLGIFTTLHIDPKQTLSIHIRRGDYTTLHDKHPVQTIDYYYEGLKILDLDSNKNVLVVSDDPHWCMETFTDHNRFKFVSCHPFVDMCMMSMCSSHVIANSSFSWWAAWLSGNKTVAPKTWFGPNGPDDWKDIYREEWVLL